jgi:hypothetical protein
LITVPSCEACNTVFATDDDYVRLVFTTTEGAVENVARNELLATVKRFADRERSKRILKSLYESLRSDYYPTPAGVLVRRQYFVVDGGRLDAFVRRVVKALFYREKGYRLPDGYGIHAIHHRRIVEAERLAGPDGDFYAFILAELIEHRERQAWGDVFGYSWVQSPNDSGATWWLLDFYGKRQYLCNTWREDASSRRVCQTTLDRSALSIDPRARS